MKKARRNMVDCQLMTNNVSDAGVLEAFLAVPRELYLPPEKQAVAYVDEDIVLAGGRCLMEPMVHARLVQAAEPKSSDVALDVGCMTGYSSAILSRLVKTVVAVEQDRDLLKAAQQNWEAQSIWNVAAFGDALAEGHSQHGPYNMIFINGAVADIPPALLQQLAPEGRLLTVIRSSPGKMGAATLVLRTGENDFSRRKLFDAACPYLPSFEPKECFTF